MDGELGLVVGGSLGGRGVRKLGERGEARAGRGKSRQIRRSHLVVDEEEITETQAVVVQLILL
jgi:hypothetical protein